MKVKFKIAISLLSLNSPGCNIVNGAEFLTNPKELQCSGRTPSIILIRIQNSVGILAVDGFKQNHILNYDTPLILRQKFCFFNLFSD